MFLVAHLHLTQKRSAFHRLFFQMWIYLLNHFCTVFCTIACNRSASLSLSWKNFAHENFPSSSKRRKSKADVTTVVLRGFVTFKLEKNCFTSSSFVSPSPVPWFTNTCLRICSHSHLCDCTRSCWRLPSAV